MAFTLQEWQDTLRLERKRISSIVSRANKFYDTDLKLSDVIGKARKAQTAEEAKEMFKQYRAITSYHDLETFVNHNTPVSTDFMNIPTFVAPKEADIVLDNFTETFLNPLSGRDTLASWTMRKWWDEFAYTMDRQTIAQAITNLKDKGYDYETFYYGSDDQSTLQVGDFIRLLMDEIKDIADVNSEERANLDYMQSRWCDIWEYQVVPEMSADYYESWADTHY